MDNFNLQVRRVEATIMSIIQESELPVSVAYLLMNKITSDLELYYLQQAQKEMNILQQENEKVETEADNT